MNSRMRAVARAAAWTGLCILTACFFGCDQNSSAPEDEGQITAGVAAADETGFKAPQVDSSRLPAGLRGRIATVEDKIRSGEQAAEAVGTLGAIYYVHGFPEAAVECFQHAVELKPDAMHWHYAIGLTYEKSGKPAEAAKAYQRALELDANYVPVYVRLASAVLDTDAVRAQQLCDRARELSPDDASVLYMAGRCAEAHGDAEAALGFYEASVKATPMYAEAHAAAGRLCAAKGDQTRAEEHAAVAEAGIEPEFDKIEVLLRTHGFDLETLLHEALRLGTSGEYRSADKVLAAAADVDVEGVLTRRAGGMVRDLEGRLDEAIAAYRAVLKAKPDMLDVRSKLADALARSGSMDEAESEFRGLLEKDPGNAMGLEGLCRLLLSLNRGGEAAELMQLAVDNEPKSARLRYQYGLVFYYLGESKKARDQFEKCVELEGKFARAKYYLGAIESARGDEDKAVEYWRETVADAPGYRDAYLALQQAYVNKKDYASAEMYLREGLANLPEDAAMNNSLAWLLATSPIEDQRNGEEALRLAELACNFTEYKAHPLIDTLGAAYARLGKFDEAVAAADQAMELAEKAGASESASDYESRKKLYEQNKAYTLGE